MNWFINLSTKAKLFYCFGIVWMLLAIIVVIAYVDISNMAASGRKMHDVQFTTALELSQLRSNQNYNRGQMLEMMLTGDKSEMKKTEDNINQRTLEIDKTIEELGKLGLNSDSRMLLEDLKNNITAYRQTRQEEISLIQSGKIEEAKKLAVSVQDERFNTIRSLAVKLGDIANADVDAQIATNSRVAGTAKTIFVIAVILAFLLGGVMILFMNKTMADPIRDIANTASIIADGDLNVTLTADNRRDEVGVLMKSFSRMTETLRGFAESAGKIAGGDLRGEITPKSEKDVLGNAFKQMTSNLRRMISDINDTVNMLSSSAGEILAATTQVASSATETATAISETTSTVEEVRQATQLSARKAQNVSDSANRVVQVAQSGQKAVEEAISGMNYIQEQMESIASTIVRLSEQGQSIGDIIATVTDLADQSNLLAVNAAIEASRAGEQGKGFAVVAQEIRNLAEQSRQATSQVRNILNDIQKATSAAVMATERGSKATEAGVKQSGQAGDVIVTVTRSSDETLQAAVQIAASSKQEEIGMDQIAVAMENINQAGIETVTSMKQTEEAAKNLHELGQRLKGMLEKYKV
jgi:methyl-accepting chemotaxis protein